MFSKADSLSMVFSGLSGFGDGLCKENTGLNTLNSTTNYLIYDDETKNLTISLNRLEPPIDANGDVAITEYDRGPEVTLNLTSGKFEPTLLMNLAFWTNSIREMLNVYPYLTSNPATDRFYETLIERHSIVIDDVGIYVQKDGDNEPCMVLTLANL